MKTTNQYTPFLLFPFLLLFVLATSLSLTAQTIYYVDAAKANNDGDGTSCENAKKDLQVALDLATAGDEIRVASGTYLPTDAPRSTTDDRNKAFHLNKDLVLKGSYNPATEMQDYTNPTILSGDIGMQDDDADNAYHVFVTFGLTDATIIDGFTLSGGNANGSGSLFYGGEQIYKSNGGGMHNRSSSPTITNSTFVGNAATNNGGGMFNEFSSPTITNSLFSGNTAKVDGGGMYNTSTSPTITNCTFSGNSAGFGSGMYNASSSPTITNSIFNGNTATTDGGGMLNASSSPTIINSTFVGNTGANGGGMRNYFSPSPILYNTVFYANIATTAGDDIDGTAIDESSSHNASDHMGGGIASHAGFVDLSSVADPFTDRTDPDGADDIFRTADDGLIPHATSPLIDAGDDTKNDEETDITGRARILGTAIDIGAYEYQSSLSSDGPVVETTALYPNPTSSEVYLNYATATNTTYGLFDMAGKRLAKFTQSGTAHQLDVSSVSKGTYILKATSGLQVNYYRIVKE